MCHDGLRVGNRTLTHFEAACSPLLGQKGASIGRSEERPFLRTGYGAG
jgi:hypothetical protein